MAVVKGSKQEEMVVVPYRPWKDVLVRLLVVMCMGLIAIGFYFFGHTKGVVENNDARSERDRLRLEVEDFTSDVLSLRQEVVNSEQARLLNERVLSDVQQTIISLREKNAQLEEDVVFYKQVISPDETETGVVVGQVDLFMAEDGAKVRYRIEFKQLGGNEEFVSGFANINVLGIQDEQEVSLPLRSLSATEDLLDIALEFKYFQNIEGELSLPDNFEAEKIQIIAVAEGANAKTVQKSFAWFVEQ